MNQIPSTPDSWPLSVTPEIKQEVEETQGNIQQQAAIGNDNNQTQNASDGGESLGDHNVCDSVPFNEPVVVEQDQVADGNHNNQNQNIINIVNQITDKDFSPFDKESSKSEKNRALPDPTKPLPQKPKNLPEVKLDELADYCNKLHEESLIIVTCPDSSTALSVAYGLTEHLPVSSKRLFTGEWGTLKKITTEPSIDIVFNPEIGEGKSTLIVIDTCEMKTFLDSLVVRSSTAAIIKQDLRSRQIFCICLAESRALETTLERKHIQLSFPHWEIPFEQAEISREEQDFRGQSFSANKDGLTAISLYETADTLKKTVLYVATFFQSLNIGDFERIVTLLLAGQTIPVIKESRTEAPKNSSEPTISVTVGDQVLTFNQFHQEQVDQDQVNSVSQSQTHKRKLLQDVWQEDAEEILKSCYLELSINEYGNRIIDFSIPHLREDLSNYFQNVKFIEYRNKFQKLVELNLLFDESSQVSKALRLLD
jgi:hypothetical protein